MTPTPKVTAAILAGSVTTVAVWLVDVITSVDVPSLVAAALTTILSVGTAYLVPDRSTG